MLPVVLLHGLFGFGQMNVGPVTVRYFRGIDRAIEKRGHPLFSPGVHPTASVERRAGQIKDAITDWLGSIGQPRGRVIVMAHSMGGLDARYMIAKLGMDAHVAALVTIATPHHGSALADFWAEHPAMQRLGMPILQMLRLDVGAAAALTREGCARFNVEIADSPYVRYYSVATACPRELMPAMLLPGYLHIHPREGENDGMVAVSSAGWGEKLATWPVHHLHAINHRWPTDKANPVKDVAPLYLKALERVEKAVV